LNDVREMSKKMNGKDMKLGEFKGEVLTTLKFIACNQEEQKADLKAIKKKLYSGSKKIAVLKWMVGATIAWLTALSGFILSKFI